MFDVQTFVSGQSFKKALGTGLVATLALAFVPQFDMLPEMLRVGLIIGVSSAAVDQFIV